MKNRKSLLLTLLLIVVCAIVFILTRENSKASDKPRVLVVLPLTGPTSSWGDHFKRGVDAFRWKTDPSIEVQVIDSQGNPAVALSAVQQACLKSKPYAIVSTLSSITVSLSEWTKREKIFLVGCMISDKILENPTNVQRVYPSVESNVDPIAQYANQNFKRVAVLYSNEDLGLAVHNEFKKRFNAGEIMFADGYAVKDADVRSLVTKALGTKPEAVFVTGVGTGFWAAIRELREQNFQGQILSDASFADQKQIANLGAAADGIIYMASETELSEPRTEKARQFNQRFLKAFNAPVNYTGVTVYESLRILDHLAESGRPLNDETFPSLGLWEGTPGTIRFIEGADSLYPWFLVKQEEGKTVPANP